MTQHVVTSLSVLTLLTCHCMRWPVNDHFGYVLTATTSQTCHH